MNILQIWLEIDGKLPSEKMMKNMKALIASLSDDDTYTLISTKNLFPKTKKVKWLNIDKYCSKMLKETSNHTVGLWNHLKGNLNEGMFKSDIIRFHYASKNENVVYVDCDVRIKKFPNFEDRVYFAQRSKVFYNNCVFYNGTNLKFFEELLDFATRSTYHILQGIYQIEITWIMFLLTRYKDQISMIEEGKYFIHKDKE